MSGGARGVDAWSEEAARDVELKVNVFEADWDSYGPKAGPIRNAQIVANCDRVIAFWDCKSRGTLNTVIQALDAGLPVTVYGADGAEVPLDTVMKSAERLGVVWSLRKAQARG